MHARELVDLAALLTTHHETLCQYPAPALEDAVQAYWTAAKCRQQHWFEQLKSFLHFEFAEDPRDRRAAWVRVRATMEEILLSEPLARVVAAMSRSLDVARGSSQLDPIAYSVFSGHLEVRQRVLRMLLACGAVEVTEAVKMNQLRRRVERWSDVLLAPWQQHVDVREFAFQAERMMEFSEDLSDRRSVGGYDYWDFLRASLRGAFTDNLMPVSANADSNRQVASAVLLLLPAQLFQDDGLARSPWLDRLYRTTEETHAMVEMLLHDDRQDFVSNQIWAKRSGE